MENKVFLGLGLLTIVSGIGLALTGQYLIGISGSIVGIWLTFDNYKKIKAKKQS